MRKYLLLTAVVSLALTSCDQGRDEPANDQMNAEEAANASDGAPATNAAMPPPEECKATDGVSDGPYCGMKAVANLFPPVKQPSLTVSGKYWLNQRTGNVVLTKAVPQGTNPKILLVKLTVEGSGGGGDWVDATGKFNATTGEFTSVQLVDPNGASIEVPVEETH